MIIGGRDLDQTRLLIAEIGNNHEGDSGLALQMAASAVESGADAVKVQVIDPLRLVNVSQQQRIQQLERFRLPFKTFEEMAEIAHAHGALFIASAFDADSLQAIAPILDAVKIASGDLDFHILLRAGAASGKPLILSTGMSTLAEIQESVDVIASALDFGRVAERLALLHCVSLYPTPIALANLRVIARLREVFGLTVGYSDHTLGIESAVASLGLGARIIEKHFTLDKTRTSFRDHALSADPSDLRRLADAVHHYEEMLGSGDKIISAAEAEMARAARRSIVARHDLAAGTKLSMDDLDCIRPRTGLAPAQIHAFVAKRLRAARQRHDTLALEDVE